MGSRIFIKTSSQRQVIVESEAVVMITRNGMFLCFTSFSWCFSNKFSFQELFAIRNNFVPQDVQSDDYGLYLDSLDFLRVQGRKLLGYGEIKSAILAKKVCCIALGLRYVQNTASVDDK